MRAMTSPVNINLEVAWGDMDAFGHVNNTVFFKYFESARIAYFTAVDPGPLGAGQLNPILASTRCDFLSPVVYPDTLRAETTVTRVGRSSLTMEYVLHSQAQDTEVARGEAVVVNVDPETGKSVALPDEVRQRIRELEMMA